MELHEKIWHINGGDIYEYFEVFALLSAILG